MMKHKKYLWLLVGLLLTIAQSQPTLHSDAITLRKVLEVGFGNIRLAQNPVSGDLYMLNPDNGIYIVDVESGSKNLLSTLLELGGIPAGMAFDADGNLYVVTNKNPDEHHNLATIHKGTPKDNGKLSWSTLASTESYPLSNTIFNHNYNGIAVSPDQTWLYVNAGSRTDHGDVQDFDGLFPGLREAPLSSKILRIPIHALNEVLPNDEAKLLEDGYLYAWGVRNAYDLAFAPNGHLFAVENGPDADYPEELNWIREGHHYGFPWKFGDWDNQQQFADYDSKNDKLQQPDFTAVREGYYQNDPDFPPPPMDFTKPIANVGPDADIYRALDGTEKDASALGEVLYSFTPHISPLGLSFVDSNDMPEALQSTEQTLSAFVLSWGAAGGTLSDKGQYLLHLALTQTEDNYEMVTTKLASDFKNPIDSVLIGNKLYVLEWGDEGAIWELTFEQ
jgi:glucose/arabinose dehydrogenase